MSGTTEPTTTTVTPTANPTDSLKSPQFIMSVMGVLMIGGCFGYNTIIGSDATKQIVLTAMISLSSVIFGFWLGSSKSSQAKDDKIPPTPLVVPSVGTTTTTVTPITTTTVTPTTTTTGPVT